LAELRITGGELGGRRIRAPRGRGGGVRPTTERVREALFSILGDVSGLRVLDLFAGTGALAIEALSRGASEATLVDRDARLARRNVEGLGLSARATVRRSDAARFLRRAEPGSFDLVLCDPPYGLDDRAARELEPLIRRCLSERGRAVVESAPGGGLLLELPLLLERRYGETLIRVHAAGEEGP
jgi:16S rRNA (guanine966-N2)-methyltransferase